MTNYLDRLKWVDAEHTRKMNPLIWPFLACTTLYGIGFALFGWSEYVSSSSLYQSFYEVHEWLPKIWGLLALLSGLASFAMLMWRTMGFGRLAAMLGAGVWIFALILYLMNGYLLVAVTVAAVNLYFWVWYYIRLAWYNYQRDVGHIHDPI